MKCGIAPLHRDCQVAAVSGLALFSTLLLKQAPKINHTSHSGVCIKCGRW